MIINFVCATLTDLSKSPSNSEIFFFKDFELKNESEN